MQSKLKRLPVWLRLSAILLVCLMGVAPFIVPVTVIAWKYDDIHSVSALPLDYWLLLLMEALSLFILNVVLRNIYGADGKPLTIVSQKGKVRSQVFWLLGALAFGYMMVKSGLDGDFIALTPTIVIADIAFLIMSLPRVGALFSKKES